MPEVPDHTISETIHLTFSALLPKRFFALSIAEFEISRTVMSVYPSCKRWSTKKLSPPPISIIASKLGFTLVHSSTFKQWFEWGMLRAFNALS